ncbi:MAG: DUF1501 domain-containing protein [Bryobacterales bacterium]|nr:DUF1501 domain-containing protein [Bryobacterales bacterium]
MAEHVRYTRNRREFLTDAFCGFGSLAFTSMLFAEQARAAKTNPLAPKPPHITPKAKSVIFLFMAGGPSHVETFDPKPLLNQLDGQKRPKEFGEAKYQFVTAEAKILGTKRTFKKYGKSGIEVSDLLPHITDVVDELAIIRSCHGDMVVHSAAQYQLMTGRIIPGFPNMGSWVTYGLGTESDSMPAYAVLPDPKGALEAGQPMYMHGFLPAVFQPAMMRPGNKPLLNLDLPPNITRNQREITVDLIRELNQAGPNAENAEFAARMNAYDLAFKMQTEAPEVFDIKRESQATLDMYGVGKPATDDYARRCLLARRMVEKGVRFVTVVSGGGPGNMQWDAHDDIEENHLRMAGHSDQPVAALIKDLKQRGLLDQTLVVWGGEFGRSPEAQGGKGRDHHNLGFSMWLAGGGIKGGQVVGATDDIGLRAVDQPYHFRDIHTTILHQMGLNQHALSYMHQGRKERLTEVEGQIIKQIV